MVPDEATESRFVTEPLAVAPQTPEADVQRPALGSESVLAGVDDGLDLLERGFADQGITPKIIPLRGGTDGSALSMRGIPTPNYFTGGLNFHSRFEVLPVPAFLITYRLTRRLIELAVP